jgi:hypothetical protein
VRLLLSRKVVIMDMDTDSRSRVVYRMMDNEGL